MEPRLKTVLDRIRHRSRQTRASYLQSMAEASRQSREPRSIACSNLAHSLVTLSPSQKEKAAEGHRQPRIAIITSYNDMLSAHQPFKRMPELIQKEMAKAGAACQVAAGVPAMCDGITQGRPGMELSLFSRDTIAMSTAIALSHDVFDGVIALGTCDKIVPGLVMGLLRFGHLPCLFLPAGPMPSGLRHEDKQKAREQYSKGQLSQESLLRSEMQSYHAPGTCTFYGTANTNQLIMEVLGLHLPGSTFIQADDPCRDDWTRFGARHLLGKMIGPAHDKPLYRLLSEGAFVNAIVAVLASAGSTNHTLHLVAMARCAGIQLTWDDFDDLSRITPQLAAMYPNGPGDVNRFEQAGGVSFLVRELLALDLLCQDVETCWGQGLAHFTQKAVMEDRQLVWRELPEKARDPEVLRLAQQPFAGHGGLRLVQGRLGRAVVRVSALPEEQWRLLAPALVFHSQEGVEKAYQEGTLTGDLVIVLAFQGPAACGMPELHKLHALLAMMQRQGQRVALLTDGRLSGASARALAAIHVSPEAARRGPLARLRSGDRVIIDAGKGILDIELSDKEWQARQPALAVTSAQGCGRELFSWMRQSVGTAETGATVFQV